MAIVTVMVMVMATVMAAIVIVVVLVLVLALAMVMIMVYACARAGMYECTRIYGVLSTAWSFSRASREPQGSACGRHPALSQGQGSGVQGCGV